MNCARAATWRTDAPPQFSRDRMWYWDGGRWIPVRKRPASHSTQKDLPLSLLIGLLLLDLAGFLPGVSVLASVVAAVVLLALDARGFVTLNGLIQWRRMRGGLRLIAVFAAIVLFQFLVIAYIAQRAFAMLARGVRRGAAVSTSPTTSVTAGDGPTAAGTRGETGISAIEPDAGTIQRGLVDLLAATRTELPQDLLEKVTSVVAAVLDVLPAYRASDLDAHDRFAVARTAGDYLPSSLRSYLRVPQGYRSVPLPDADGKTANQVLSDQLDLMTRRMQAVADTAYRKDVEQLLVHGRFLRSKFGGSGLSVDS